MCSDQCWETFLGACLDAFLGGFGTVQWGMDSRVPGDGCRIRVVGGACPRVPGLLGHRSQPLSLCEPQGSSVPLPAARRGPGRLTGGRGWRGLPGLHARAGRGACRRAAGSGLLSHFHVSSLWLQLKGLGGWCGISLAGSARLCSAERGERRQSVLSSSCQPSAALGALEV